MRRGLIFCVLILTLWSGRTVSADLGILSMHHLTNIARICGYSEQYYESFGLDHLSLEKKGRFLEFAEELGVSDEQISTLSEEFDRGRRHARADGYVEGLGQGQSEEFLNELVAEAELDEFLCSGRLFEPILPLLRSRKLPD